ncbi:type IV pilin protein, partial [Neisseria meningitidis]
MTDNRGFTLVELISVVLILSVLALIVYPSYRNYVEKAKINA